MESAPRDGGRTMCPIGLAARAAAGDISLLCKGLLGLLQCNVKVRVCEKIPKYFSCFH